MSDAQREGQLVNFPGTPDPGRLILSELELVYPFIYARVGNRPDAEDLTQQVALKALPRLRLDAAPQAIRSYLFATARSVLAAFWATKLTIPEQELSEELGLSATAEEIETPETAVHRLERILGSLPANYRRVLELRFLRGYSLKEAAQEMSTTTANIKVMQLRALRAAANRGLDA